MTDSTSMDCVSIGVVRSSFAVRENAPRQGAWTDETCALEIDERFQPALIGLDQYSHIWVLFWADRADRDVVTSDRHRQWGEERGVFASRSPARPNPIGLTVCELVSVDDCTVTVRGLEALDGTPVVDIKPFVRELDCPTDSAFGT